MRRALAEAGGQAGVIQSGGGINEVFGAGCVNANARLLQHCQRRTTTQAPGIPMADRPSGTNSQRTLAAIVFTDAVSFSARMQKDEVGTLRILQRDFGEMRRICAEHEGAVLKTTGDGLLMTFSSAVHAVACALAMQRQFAAEAKEELASKILLHRIGIHIGDIIVQDQDVMGDGVNIAARLQAEAEPGGICISQTVYDVVKNKIELQAVHLGPRDLKNISQAIPVYRLLLEAQGLQSGASRPPIPVPTAQPAPKAGGNRTLLVVGAVAVLAVVFAAGLFLSRRPESAVQAEGVKTPAVTPAVQPAVVQSAPPATTPTAAVPTAPAQPAPGPVNDQARRRELAQARTQFLEKYDFAGLAKSIQDNGEAAAGRGNVQVMLVAAEQMAAMKVWLEATLRRYTRQNPLLVSDVSGANQPETRVFLDSQGKLIFILGNAIQPRDWSATTPLAMGNIIVSAIRDARPAAPREVVQGAMAFARNYTLPGMEAIVVPLLPAGTQPRGGRAAGNNLPARGR